MVPGDKASQSDKANQSVSTDNSSAQANGAPELAQLIRWEYKQDADGLVSQNDDGFTMTVTFPDDHIKGSDRKEKVSDSTSGRAASAGDSRKSSAKVEKQAVLQPSEHSPSYDEIRHSDNRLSPDSIGDIYRTPEDVPSDLGANGVGSLTAHEVLVQQRRMDQGEATRAERTQEVREHPPLSSQEKYDAAIDGTRNWVIERGISYAAVGNPLVEYLVRNVTEGLRAPGVETHPTDIRGNERKENYEDAQTALGALEMGLSVVVPMIGETTFEKVGLNLFEGERLGISGTEMRPEEISKLPGPVESANAERYAFGDAPKTYKDKFAQQEFPIAGAREARPGANTFDRASLAESVDYNQQTAPKHLGGEGKVGIQRPGVVNAGGPDSIVFDSATGKIEVRDTKGRGPGGSFPQSPSRQEVARKWGHEIDRAIVGDAGDPMGGVRTGDAALDQQIRNAWHNGNWEYVQVNVHLPALPPKGPLIDLGPL